MDIAKEVKEEIQKTQQLNPAKILLEFRQKYPDRDPDTFNHEIMRILLPAVEIYTARHNQVMQEQQKS